MELVCPAGSLPALKAAVDNGANAVYLGFRMGAPIGDVSLLPAGWLGGKPGIGNHRPTKVMVSSRTGGFVIWLIACQHGDADGHGFDIDHG